MQNWKKLIVTVSALASLAIFAGCTSASAVSLEEAKELVKDAMDARDAVVVEHETDRDDGVYELELIIDGVGYEFEVDSQTGEVREVEREDDRPAQTQPIGTKPAETRPAETQPTRITLEEALAIAYEHAGVREADAYDKSYEHDDGMYEIDFEYDGFEYEYDISYEGRILKSKKEPEDDRRVSATQPAETQPARITAEEALAIAMKHAGVTDAGDRDVEWDDGRWEVSFESGRTEYEYKIGADGTIVHWEKEHND